MDTKITNCLPTSRAECRARLANLRNDIAAIKAQIAAADIERQGERGRMDPRWFHRAKTALRHKLREVELVMAHMADLPGRKETFKDHLIEVVREDYDDAEWRDVLDEAHRRLNANGGE
ncbi:MAG: hypothetical protein HZC25_08840 [Rhodospirillales bacterium]|nr:hypothetical protein [Rhodospirillales bacterium]